MNITQQKELNIGNTGAGEASIPIPGTVTAERPQAAVSKIFVSCTLANNANDKRIKIADFLTTHYDSSATLNGQTGEVDLVFDRIAQRWFVTVWKDDAPLFARLISPSISFDFTLKIQGEDDDDIVVTKVLVNDSPLYS